MSNSWATDHDTLTTNSTTESNQVAEPLAENLACSLIYLLPPPTLITESTFSLFVPGGTNPPECNRDEHTHLPQHRDHHFGGPFMVTACITTRFSALQLLSASVVHPMR
ncbi:MAG: hypothetical protein GW893_01610 [Armatimonadetes bacterium]|nr:hypothetical protein [Armatimonadota bacterium]